MKTIDRYEALINEDEACAKREVEYATLITTVLTKALRVTPLRSLGIPYVSYRSGTPHIHAHTIREVVADECSSGEPLDELMAVIASSDCPLVSNLRVAIAARYVAGNAADLAGVPA